MCIGVATFPTRLAAGLTFFVLCWRGSSGKLFIYGSAPSFGPLVPGLVAGAKILSHEPMWFDVMCRNIGLCYIEIYGNYLNRKDS
jgi:hypothetical protein